jgi:hypothetical protein
MKHVNAFANEIDVIVGNPKFQIDFDIGSTGDVNKEPLDQSLQMTLQNKTKGKRSTSLNTFQPWLKITL